MALSQIHHDGDLFYIYTDNGSVFAGRFATRKRTAMPLIQVSIIKGVFSPEQKAQIIPRLTDALVSIEGENMRPVTWVKVDEISSGDWGIGGQFLTTEAVQALAAGKAPVAT